MKIKLLNDLAKVPTRGSKDAAGFDLYAATNYNIEIRPNEVVKIDTGISVEIPKGYFGAIFARSGLATKQGLRPANAVGVIDADYRGNIIVALYNDSTEPQTVLAQSRIAQLVLIPYSTEEIEIVNELNDTLRGEGGFGSTGVAD